MGKSRCILTCIEATKFYYEQKVYTLFIKQRVFYLVTAGNVRIFTLKLKVKVMIKYSELQDLTIDELTVLKGQVNALIQGKQVIALGKIKVGDKVMVNHKKAGGEYTVVKLNRKTYTLENMFGRVKCSIGLISPIAA